MRRVPGRPDNEVPLRRRASVAAALLAAVALAGCGGSSNKPDSGDGRQAERSFAGAALPPRPAPLIDLHDERGRRVTLEQFRGKAVLVTFLYTRCPDICPLIVGHLRAVQHSLGATARRLQILAVSVDPKGDTPRAARAFLRAHDMTGRMRWLIGTRRQLERTWRAWGVAAARDPKDPELVEHSAPLFGIGASGRRLTIYPTSFKRTEIAHDVPLLAAR